MKELFGLKKNQMRTLELEHGNKGWSGMRELEWSLRDSGAFPARGRTLKSRADLGL